MAKDDDMKHDILLIVATILFFSFFVGTGSNGGDSDTAFETNPTIFN